ncbi:hypothetical protein [Myxococcus sp. AB036A]|nr:hypothetical protein [Myxococcus sp. AB036A]
MEQELRCEQTPYGDHYALFQLTYSCKDPVTCQQRRCQHLKA